MDKKTVSFSISKRLADTFMFAVSISDTDPDVIFENFARQFTAETLKKLGVELCAPPKESDFVSSDFISMDSYNAPSKAERKIPLWARRLNQINAQIIRAYFLAECGGVASRKEMREIFLRENPSKSISQFECNLSSMCTDKAKSHGHIFDCYGDDVYKADGASRILMNHKEMFIR